MKVLGIILLLLCLGDSHSQWVSAYFGQSSGDIDLTTAKGNSIKLDHSGKPYVGGSVNLGSAQDMLLIKYKNNGDTDWVRTYNGTENQDDKAFGIVVDENDNIYVVGTARNTKNYYDFVVLKYSSSGSLLWERTYPGIKNGEDKAISAVVDQSGNIYITGYCTGADYKFDMLTMKYSPNGTLLWSITEDGEEHLNTQGESIALDNSGNVYVTGYTTSASNHEDIIVVKYNPDNGEQIWRKTYNGSGNSEDKAWGIVVDKDQFVYITGHTTSAKSNIDCITLQLACQTGNLGWAAKFNGSGNSEDKAWGIVVDTDGLIYITGQTTSSGNNVNYLTMCYLANGNVKWGPSEYNGPGNGDDKAYAITAIYTGSSRGVKSIVVTGGSIGNNNNNDYATVTYNAGTGSQRGDAVRYSLNASSDDIALDIDSKNMNVYVTGYSDIISFSGSSAAVTQMINLSDNNENNTMNIAPEKFSLYQNYPNPFNPSTNIKFDVPASSFVKITIYDVLGKIVDVPVNQQLEAGTYDIKYTNAQLASGIYFYELKADGFQYIKKMTIVK